MVTARACSAAKENGDPCRSPRLLDADYCLMHDPDRAEEVAEARRLGGLRRRKEKAVEGAYDFDGLQDVGQIRRLLEIAVLDTLSLENSVARSRTLAYLAQVSLKMLEVGELEQRLRGLEDTISPRTVQSIVPASRPRPTFRPVTIGPRGRSHLK